MSFRILLLLLPVVLFCEESEIKHYHKSESSKESFNYFRYGGYIIIIGIPGVNVAYGSRYKTSSHGAMGYSLNASCIVPPFEGYKWPYLSVKGEFLRYFKNGDGSYVGVQPGIGLMRRQKFEIFGSSRKRWRITPNLEFVVGKEYDVYGKKRFYYVGTNGLSISVNYGIGF